MVVCDSPCVVGRIVILRRRGGEVMVYIKSGLKGLKGGQKSHYLRLHRTEILNYAREHGEVAARNRYNIKRDMVWERLVNRPSRHPEKFSKVDRAILRVEIAEEAVRELRADVSDLKTEYSRFVELVADQVKTSLLVALVQSQIKAQTERLKLSG